MGGAANGGGSILNTLGDPSLREGIAMWANSMRLNPDPNMGAMIERRRSRRDEEQRRNKTVEVLKQMAPEAASLVEGGLMSPAEALALTRDEEARRLAAEASDALARGDYQRAYALSLRISPTAAGQAIAQRFGPRPPDVSADGMTTITYGPDGTPQIAVNENVVDARMRLRQREAEAMRQPSPPPASIVNAEEQDFAALDTLDSLNMEAARIIGLIDEGKLDTTYSGTAEALAAQFGLGDKDKAQAREAWERFKIRYVNDSLRLNAGVQTEGDAQRAGQEIMTAPNPASARNALTELIRLNQIARDLKTRSITGRRERYGLDPAQVPPPPQMPDLAPPQPGVGGAPAAPAGVPPIGWRKVAPPPGGGGF